MPAFLPSTAIAHAPWSQQMTIDLCRHELEAILSNLTSMSRSVRSRDKLQNQFKVAANARYSLGGQPPRDLPTCPKHARICEPSPAWVRAIDDGSFQMNQLLANAPQYTPPSPDLPTYLSTYLTSYPSSSR
eukprot:6211370-Pleurochrysis_carterae.AAC.2